MRVERRAQSLINRTRVPVVINVGGKPPRDGTPDEPGCPGDEDSAHRQMLPARRRDREPRPASRAGRPAAALAAALG